MNRGVESYSFLLGITDFLIKILYSHLAFPRSWLCFTSGKEVACHASITCCCTSEPPSSLFTVCFYISWGIFKSSQVVTILWLFNFFWKWLLLHPNGIGAAPTAHFEAGRSPTLQKDPYSLQHPPETTEQYRNSCKASYISASFDFLSPLYAWVYQKPDMLNVFKSLTLRVPYLWHY